VDFVSAARAARAVIVIARPELMRLTPSASLFRLNKGNASVGWPFCSAGILTLAPM
jgi:hypothetical protein